MELAVSQAAAAPYCPSRENARPVMSVGDLSILSFSNSACQAADRVRDTIQDLADPQAAFREPTLLPSQFTSLNRRLPELPHERCCLVREAETGIDCLPRGRIPGPPLGPMVPVSLKPLHIPQDRFPVSSMNKSVPCVWRTGEATHLTQTPRTPEVFPTGRDRNGQAKPTTDASNSNSRDVKQPHALPHG